MAPRWSKSPTLAESYRFADELTARSEDDGRAPFLKSLLARAAGEIRALADTIDDMSVNAPKAVTIAPGAITIQPGQTVSPADVARITARAIDVEKGPILPAGPTEPSTVRPPQKFQMGEITDRDRFLDDASDRRAALMAASRIFADQAVVHPENVINMTATYYNHLREGKP